MNLTTWAWLIVPLGVTRAMQIVLWDRITQRPRDWLLEKLNPAGYGMKDPRRPYLSYLLECPWCVSVWLGLVVVGLVLWDATRAVALAVLAALALSLLAVLIDRAIDRTLPDELPNPVVTARPGELPVELREQDGGGWSAEPVPWAGDVPDAVRAAFDDVGRTGDDATGAS